MANIIKTEYMKRATIGFSEYLASTESDLPTNPKPGDRCLVASGKVFVCIENGEWEELKIGGGGSSPTGTIEISENGEYDVAEYANASVEVETGNIGYQVKFKVDGEDYYVVSCQQGESITEPPIPTVETGKTFTGWKDGNGNAISFPYTPVVDIELTANIVNYNFLVSAGETICTIDSIDYVLASGRNNDICAVCLNTRSVYPFNDRYTPIVISTTNSPNSCYTYNDGAAKTSSVKSNMIYNGTTYYYSNIAPRDGDLSNTNNRYVASTVMSDTSTASFEAVVTEVLNAYFGTTE